VKPRVLIVEDEKILAEAACLYLTRHGYPTRMTHSGEEALAVLEDARPDVAILDVKLPGIDGFEVLRRLRVRSPSTEVVMMTAYSSDRARAEAMKHGVFHYLSKPVDLEELCAVVDRALAAARGDTPWPVRSAADDPRCAAALTRRCGGGACGRNRAACPLPAKVAC
jgi:DNA-binding response OmpR family regulator